MANLIPDYISLDFNSLVSKLKDEISNSNVFADVDYEGSNISTLIELLAYIGEIQLFLTNRLAVNSTIGTADQYEAVNRLAEFIGYDPKGYISATTNLTVTVSDGISIGDNLYVPAFKTIQSTQTYDGSTIEYITVTSTTATVDEIPFSFSLYVKQGESTTYESTGEDIVNNQIILPLEDFDYDNDLTDDYHSIVVEVNGIEWERVTDFYENMLNLEQSTTNDNVYKFLYDEYKRYKIVFSNSRNVPDDSDSIDIRVIKTLGVNGAVGSGTITNPSTNFLNNLTLSSYIDADNFSITNSNATQNSSIPQTIDEIRESAKQNLRTQYRNVVDNDYIFNLEERSDITKANVWGEQDITPSGGNIDDYNKVYITIIPDTWGNDSIKYISGSIIDGSTSASTIVPYEYNDDWKETISLDIGDRKFINAYEYYSLPSLIYFWFKFGVRIKRTYNFNDVQTDLLNKLIYYFLPSNRRFEEEIDYMDIIYFLLDDTETSPDDEFTNIKGIKNLVIRDIDSNVTIYEPNSLNNYPQYVESASSYPDENKLRRIQLKYDQFPMLPSALCTFTEEN